MAMTEQTVVPTRKQLWRRIVEFPLVAMVLAIALLLLGLILVGAALEQLPNEILPRSGRSVVYGLLLTAATLAIYKLAVRRMGEEPRDDLPFDKRFGDVWRGTVVAVLLMTAIVAIAALLGGYRISGWGDATSWASLLFMAGLRAAVVEEIFMRGVLFRFLEEFGGSWFALAVSSLIFGFLHAGNPNATLFSSFAIALEAGILLGGAYMLTRNLWLAVGLHFGWNVTQGLVWDVPVSGGAVDGLVEARIAGPEIITGGAFGLEASAIAVVAATALGVWLVVLAIRRGHIVKPWWVRRREARLVAAQTKL